MCSESRVLPFHFLRLWAKDRTSQLMKSVNMGRLLPLSQHYGDTQMKRGVEKHQAWRPHSGGLRAEAMYGLH